MMEVLRWESNGFLILLLPVTALLRGIEKQQDRLQTELHKLFYYILYNKIYYIIIYYKVYYLRINKRWTQVGRYLVLGKQRYFLFVKANLCTEFQANKGHALSKTKKSITVHWTGPVLKNLSNPSINIYCCLIKIE